MLKNLKNRLNESKGFTLVELIVVIAIMVILIALLVPNVVGYISSSQTTANLSAAKSIYNAANTAVVNGKASTSAFPTEAQLINLLNGDSINTAGDDNGTDLVTVPTGTSAILWYVPDSGEVTGVATGSTASDSTAVAPTATDCTATTAGVAPATTNVNNVALYDPKVSGNAAEHLYGSGETHPSAVANVVDLTCLNGTWS